MDDSSLSLGAERTVTSYATSMMKASAKAATHGGSSSTAPSASTSGAMVRSASVSALLKTMGKLKPMAVQFDRAPYELCYGASIDLSRWTMVVTDQDLIDIGRNSARNESYYYVDAGKDEVSKMFHSFYTPMTTPLRSLDISGSKEISDHGIASVARSCRNLQVLNISSCTGITDVGLREVAMHCPYLDTLNISSCHSIEGGGLVAVGEGCPKLRKLDVSHCRKLQRWAISKICYKCTNIEEINVSHLLTVGDEEIRVLTESSPRLLWFDAKEAVNLSDNALMHIAGNCPDIDYVDISRTQMISKISDVGLLALAEKSKSLRVLLLSGCDNITDVGISWVAQGCVTLEEVDLSACTKLTDAALRSLGSGCSSLSSVNITGAKYVSDVGIASLTSGCPQLKKLISGGLYLLADPRIPNSKKAEEEAWKPLIGLAALAAHCPLLETLDTTGCFRLNEVFKTDVAQGLHNLTTLTTTGCNGLSPASFTAIAEGCPKLVQINFSDCPGVSAGPMRAFANNCRDLKIVVLQRCRNLQGGCMKAIGDLEHIEKLDISGCNGVVDSDMLPLCSVDRTIKLKTLILNNCKHLTDSSLAWISSARSGALRLLSFKGTAMTRQSAQAVRDSYPLSDMLFNENFSGFWPKSRLNDRILMNNYFKVFTGITKLQGRVRKMIATAIMKELAYRKRVKKAATKVALVFQMAHAKLVVQRKRDLWTKKQKFAFTITSMFHVAIAKRDVRNRRAAILFDKMTASSIKIQRIWRYYWDKKTADKIRQAFLTLVRRRRWAQTVLQSASRMWKCMYKATLIKQHIAATKALRERKALLIQRVYRGHVDRSIVRSKRQLKKYEHLLQVESAVRIQRRLRARKTGTILDTLVAFRRKKFRSAAKIQALARGRIARWRYRELRLKTRDELLNRNATIIQTQLRVMHARMIVQRLRRERAEWITARSKAVTVFSKFWRAKEARAMFAEMKKIREMELRDQALLELWSAVKIQAVFRGYRGRIYFDEKLREKKGKWKELFDEEKGRRFFYNKLTGEIRWRMPKDLLDLIPRPKCDNCEKFEAGVECAVCDEVFCSECWCRVHAGGRRKDHEFRALYDYYGKRIDYGDGSYPCKWSTELIQDEIQGWMLRVAPIRDPISVYGDWEYYGDDSMKIRNPSFNHDASRAFYFNRKTFETSYEMPPDVAYYTQTPNYGTTYGYATTGTYDASQNYTSEEHTPVANYYGDQQYNFSDTWDSNPSPAGDENNYKSWNQNNYGATDGTNYQSDYNDQSYNSPHPNGYAGTGDFNDWNSNSDYQPHTGAQYEASDEVLQMSPFPSQQKGFSIRSKKK